MNTVEKSSKDTFNSLVQDPGWFESYENKATAFNNGEMCAVGDTPEEATQNAQEQGINPDFVGEVTRSARREAMEINSRHLDF
ncbi:MAG: hypothetical protein ACRBB3_08530 [Alphaproteobacteria bacterium]